MKKYLLGFAVLAGIVAVVAATRPARAIIIAPTDIYGAYLNDGDLISAAQSSGDPDIFIVKLKPVYSPAGEGDLNGYKRLFLNPAIFNMYGHLGGFSRVRQVTAGVRDSFETSGLFRNCETSDQKVWATEVTGEDDGILHHVQMTGDQAYREDPRFFDKVFCINSREERFYAKSITPYYRLADVPRYFRRTCLQRPACLDTEPRCLLPEPVEGWCPKPTPTSCVTEGNIATGPCCRGLVEESVRGLGYGIGAPPYCVRPGCYYQQVQCVTTPCNPVLVCPSPAPTCYPLPACAYPGANPACDLATYGPDGRPWCSIGVLGNYATITGVSLRRISDTSYAVDITGTLPTPCDTLTEEVSHGSNRYDIELRYHSNLGPNDGACVQVIQPFSRSITISTAGVSAGTHYVYVNNDSRFLLSLTK